MILPNFKLWIGIVESRADPENLGRCKVRVLGYHTANTVTLPYNDLPWATVMMPVTSASMSGVSETPALLPGSTVVGFWADGNDEQNPVVIGSLPGIPVERIEDPNVGFSDPHGKFPRTEEDEGYNDLNEPDLSRLARGDAAEKHASLTQKRENRVEQIPTATAPSITTVTEDLPGIDYFTGSFDEPHPRFGSTDTGTYTTPGEAPTFAKGTTSVYPFNKVTETESGHVFEVDDTPNNGRIHEYHNSGTFREIQHDGTTVTKIVGDDYEICAKGKNVSIAGACNITVKGDFKLRVDGDYYEEIGGHKFTTIGKNHHTKITGNNAMEVDSGMSVNVSEDWSLRAGKTTTLTSVGSFNMTAGDGYSCIVKGDHGTSVTGNSTLTTIGSINVAAVQNITHTAIATYRASGTKMSLLGIADQKVVGGANQLIEAGAMQTLSSVGLQNTIAGVRQITTPVTTHTGMYSVIGTIIGTAVTTITGVGLGTHKHIGVTSGPAISGIPVP